MNCRRISALSVLTLAWIAAGCGAVGTTQDSVQPSSSEIVVLSPTSLQNTTDVPEIAPEETSVEETSPITATSDPAEVPEADLSTLQREIIQWRTFQRQYTQQSLPDGETAEQTACIVELAILALPEELLPQLTNPARETLDLATIDLFGYELQQASAVC